MAGKPTITLRFQIEKQRVVSDGIIRDTYAVWANTGLGKTKAREVAALLNRQKITVRRRPLRSGDVNG